MSGKADGHRRAEALGRFESDRAMELGHQLAADGQPESVALDSAAFIASQADKGLEDPLVP